MLPPSPAAINGGQFVAQRVVDAAEVDAEHSGPVRRFGLVQQDLVARYARAVHRERQRTQRAHLLDRRPHRVVVGHVRGDRERLAATAFDLLDHLADRIGRQTHHADSRTPFGQKIGHGRADTGAGAGHNGGPAVEPIADRVVRRHTLLFSSLRSLGL
jgi:hypothetical protein